MSHPYAAHYVDQFPKVKTEMVSRTVAFIAGALVTVLAIASLIDPEMFLSFEITRDRTVLFYVGVLGAIWAFAHGSISEENNVFDPEYALRNVIEYTHYEPDHWSGRLHSYEVKKEFSELYKMKVIIFAEEILSILITPLMLLFTLPRSSDQVIDFFREFTIHVDGLGYVCSFAEFDFKKGIGNAKKTPDANPADVRDDYYTTKHGKMEASYYGFIGNYGNYMLNPKMGTQGHLPPGLRHQFNPPPAWPTMNSPTLGAGDMQTSRIGRSDRARSRTAARTPRFGPAVPLPSPMGSILLDPHHQPPGPSGGGTLGNKSMHWPRQRGHVAERNIIEESAEDDGLDDGGREQEDEEAYGGSGAGLMDESTWQTSPTKTLSRENSAGDKEEPVAGVVGMIYQFNQAQLNRRPGGVR
jgi:autophagy-related protein 9